MASDDWFVPGAKIGTGDAGGVIRLRPPQHWRRVELLLNHRPPSMNDNKIRSQWRGFHRAKKSWQEEIMTLLMVAAVSRQGYQRAVAGAFIRFERRMPRADPGNYAGLINKALGDALVEYGAIPDDDDTHYVWGGVEFDEGVGARTRVIVYLQPEEG